MTLCSIDAFHVPTRREFRVERGVLGVAVFIRSPLGVRNMVVNTETEAEVAISNLIDEERAREARLLNNPYITL